MAKNSIGQFIAALRKANGMTQQEVADRLNVSNKAVSRWERDECAPDLSLIPPLAEMFGVTCDELLKGERIMDAPQPEKKEPKVEKQVKALVNRTISGFKTLIWISLAVSVVGLVCMFGISYGFYRPVIGFAVMLLFEACALAITILAVSRTKDVKTDNELFDEADASLQEKFNNALGTYTFVSFFVIFSVILLSLPLIMITSAYVESVLAIGSYFTIFFGGIILILLLVFLKCRKPYTDWITGNQPQEKEINPVTCKVQKMTKWQIAMTVLGALLFVLAPYGEVKPTEDFSLFEVIILAGLACLVGNIVCFFVFLIKNKEEEKAFILPGIRNIMLIPSALWISEVHDRVWFYFADENEASIYDNWQTGPLWHAIGLAVLIFVIFSLIDVLIKRRGKGKQE